MCLITNYNIKIIPFIISAVKRFQRNRLHAEVLTNKANARIMKRERGNRNLDEPNLLFSLARL